MVYLRQYVNCPNLGCSLGISSPRRVKCSQPEKEKTVPPPRMKFSHLLLVFSKKVISPFFWIWGGGGGHSVDTCGLHLHGSVLLMDTSCSFVPFSCPQNGPLPLKYRVRPNCKKMKVSHAQQEGQNSTSRSGLESDSASDKAGSPAGAPSTSSSLPSPGTPAQSPQPPAPSSVNGTPAAAPSTPGRSFTQFGSGGKPRKVSLNGSSGWRGAPDWTGPERPLS